MNVANLLRELPKVRQRTNEPARRWFATQGMDLIVWHEADHVLGFQLCYEKDNKELALTWKRGRGFDHSAIDSGEQVPTRNRTPILVPDGSFDANFVSKLFGVASQNVPEEIRNLVADALRRYPNE